MRSDRRRVDRHDYARSARVTSSLLLIVVSTIINDRRRSSSFAWGRFYGDLIVSREIRRRCRLYIYIYISVGGGARSAKPAAFDRRISEPTELAGGGVRDVRRRVYEGNR